MEKFTVEQARALMPDRFKEMVEMIHERIRIAAENGLVEIVMAFDMKYNVNKAPWKVVHFLREEGYSVILSILESKATLSFDISWRES